MINPLLLSAQPDHPSEPANPEGSASGAPVESAAGMVSVSSVPGKGVHVEPEVSEPVTFDASGFAAKPVYSHASGS